MAMHTERFFTSASMASPSTHSKLKNKTTAHKWLGQVLLRRYHSGLCPVTISTIHKFNIFLRLYFSLIVRIREIIDLIY